MWQLLSSDPLALLFVFFALALFLAAVCSDTPAPPRGGAGPGRAPGKTGPRAVFKKAPRPDILERG
jgi:hypothetical protein